MMQTIPPSHSQAEEQFRVDKGALVRRLSIGGNWGESTTPLLSTSAIRFNSEDQEWIQDIWDQSFLRGLVEHTQPQGMPQRTVRIADVFCGAGGLSHGVRDAVLSSGMRAKNILAIDVDSNALEVYRRNFNPTYYSTNNLWTSITLNYSSRRSTFSSDPKPLTEELEAAVGYVDILLGGPPCEGHSNSNNVTRRSDPRNPYYVVMPALAAALGAEAVIIENVPGVRHDSRHILEEAKGLFRACGYYLSESVVSAVELGLPQTRKRHILVASRSRTPDLPATIEVLHRPKRDLRWAIGDLVEADPINLMDTPAELSETNKRRIDYLFDTGQYNLTNALRPESHRAGHTYPAIYGRLHWDKPAGTITTGFNTPGRGRYIHPERRRTLTPHEAARIQGFPDNFAFELHNGNTPTRSQLAKMIGSAVPPQIGYAAGVAALASMD